MNVRAHIFVSGRVQGVYFRQNTKEQAQRHGVRGWVKNLDDGRVETVFEGEDSAVNAMVEFCNTGPKGASVTAVTVEWESVRDEFQGFNVLE